MRGVAPKPYRRRGRPGWYARISIRGTDGRSRRVERFIGPDRAAADEYLAAWRADEERRRLGVVRPKLLAEFAADELFPVRAPIMRPKSFEIFSGAILKAAEHFGRRPMYSITAADAAGYVADLARRGRAGNTIRNQVNALRAAWNAAVTGRVALGNPWAKVAIPRIDERPVPYLSEQDLDDVVAAAPARIRDLVRILAETGARLGEILRLQWQDVSRDLAAITIHGTKTGRARVVPLTAVAREVFQRLRAARGSRNGEELVLGIEEPLGARTREDWRKAMAAHGHPRLRLHDLRHARASLLVRAGVPVPSVARWLGHASPAMVLARYGAHAPAGELAQALASLERSRGPRPPST